MTEQPTALRLADALTTLTGTQKDKHTTAKQAAEELRRLHAENALLHKALRQTVRTYMVADEAWDPEAETERAMNIVMERARK